MTRRSYGMFQVDAFTDTLFKGNPAAVVVLDEWIDDAVMQKIAMENNLSETAFIVRQETHFEITWFTPICEIDLCGHATLAAAHVIFNHLGHTDRHIRFTTRHVGDLFVSRENDRIILDFPVRTPDLSTPVPDHVLKALSGAKHTVSHGGQRYLIVYETSDDIRNISVDFDVINAADHSVIVTALASKEDGCDYVCRYFCAGIGIGEDPVTGSAQCVLIPYWAQKLGRKTLVAKQLSPRGGTLYCSLKDDRVLIGGNAITYLEGTISV